MTFRNGAHSVVRFRSSYTNFGRFRYYSREKKGEGRGGGGKEREIEGRGEEKGKEGANGLNMKYNHGTLHTTKVFIKFIVGV